MLLLLLLVKFTITPPSDEGEGLLVDFGNIEEAAPGIDPAMNDQIAEEVQQQRPAEREQVGVIHTLCIHPARSGKGLARQMVAFCEAESRRLGKTVIRLDTWEGNLPANRLYPTLGYRYAGAAEFFFMGFIHETLNCYEKGL